jgi:uncharacterized protein (DUF302 family)
MSYYLSKTFKNTSFDEAVEKVTGELKKEGFGIITQIDMKETFKNKINVDFRKYKILGACNPHFAYKALQNEDKIGTMLPCNVIVQEHENGEVEISAVDPVASMSAVKNHNLSGLAVDVLEKIKRVVDGLSE